MFFMGSNVLTAVRHRMQSRTQGQSKLGSQPGDCIWPFYVLTQMNRCNFVLQMTGACEITELK